MQEPLARVLVVDDFEPWHNFVLNLLHERPELLVIGKSFDGLDAVQKAQQLQPDLILMDVGLPSIHGIEAARRCREVCPKAKVLFVSENRSREVVEEAFRSGAVGYVVKSNAASGLLPAIDAVLRGERFVSASLVDEGFTGAPRQQGTAIHDQDDISSANQLKGSTAIRHHEVEFYFEDARFMDDLIRFVVAGLQAGNAVIVIATRFHLEGLLTGLKRLDLDADAALEQGQLAVLDAGEAHSAVMVNGVPDPSRFLAAVERVILQAQKAVKSINSRVAIFGECVDLLWSQGNTEAALEFEKLGNQLVQLYDLHILCGYFLGGSRTPMDGATMRRICAQHSAAHFR